MSRETAVRTPGPWAVRGPNLDIGSERHLVAMIPAKNSSPLAQAELAANAAFIVKACNAHQALVEALKGLLEAPELAVEIDDISIYTAKCIDRANAALAMGEKP